MLKENVENIQRLKMPVLKLDLNAGGPSIFYSENSLKNLAINDSSYLDWAIIVWEL